MHYSDSKLFHSILNRVISCKQVHVSPWTHVLKDVYNCFFNHPNHWTFSCLFLHGLPIKKSVFWYFFDQDTAMFLLSFWQEKVSMACYYLFHFNNLGVDSCNALENLRYAIIYTCSLNVQLTHISFLVNIYCVLWIH